MHKAASVFKVPGAKFATFIAKRASFKRNRWRVALDKVSELELELRLLGPAGRHQVRSGQARSDTEDLIPRLRVRVGGLAYQDP